jgi:malate dehydrogenase (oxaloacetate-decarboxylating)(NADP+)
MLIVEVMAKPIHVLVSSTTTRGIVNMTALVASESREAPV